MGISASRRSKHKVRRALRGGTKRKVDLSEYTFKAKRVRDDDDLETTPRFVMFTTTSGRRVGIPSMKTDLPDLGKTQAIQTRLSDSEMDVVLAYLKGQDVEAKLFKRFSEMLKLYEHVTFLMLDDRLKEESLESQIVRHVVASLDLNIAHVWQSLSKVEQKVVTAKSKFLQSIKEFEFLPARFAKIVGYLVHLCPAMSKYATLMIPPNQFVVRTTNAMLYARLHTIGESRIVHEAPAIQVPPHLTHHTGGGNTMFQDVLPDVIIDKMLNQEVYTFWEDRIEGGVAKRHLVLQATTWQATTQQVETWQKGFGEVAANLTEFSTCNNFVFVCTVGPSGLMTLVLVNLTTQEATPCVGFQARKGDVVDIHNVMQDLIVMPERPKICCSGQLVCIPKTDHPSGVVVIDFKMQGPMTGAAPTGWYTFIPSQVVWQGNIASNGNLVAWVTTQGIALWRASPQNEADALDVFSISDHDLNVSVLGMTPNGKYLIAGAPYVNNQGEAQGSYEQVVKIDVQNVLQSLHQEEEEEEEEEEEAPNAVSNLSAYIERPFVVSCTNTTVQVVYRHNDDVVLGGAQLEGPPNWLRILNFGDREVHQVALPSMQHKSFWNKQGGVMCILKPYENALHFDMERLTGYRGGSAPSYGGGVSQGGRGGGGGGGGGGGSKAQQGGGGSASYGSTVQQGGGSASSYGGTSDTSHEE